MLLLTAVLGLGFLAVRTANLNHANRRIEADLRAGARFFDRLVYLRLEQLSLSASLMSDDWAFRRLVGEIEDFDDPVQRRTLVSALENYRLRVSDTAFLGLASISAECLVDTRIGVSKPSPGLHAGLLAAAGNAEDLTATAFDWSDGQAFILLAVPVLLPEPNGWIIAGFRVDDALAGDFSKLTGLEVSFAHKPAGSAGLIASTLPPALRADLANGFSTHWGKTSPFRLLAGGDAWISFWSPLPEAGGSTSALLQRSWSLELAPYKRLERTLLLLTLLALAVSVPVSARLANSISRPVESLTRAAKRIGEGDYREPVEISSEDELGRLADAFNHMAEGLDERDRVRDLLGKVVSPEIATELLRFPPALGGEERETTIMFTDLRGFTRMSESVTPSELLGMLNGYFTLVSQVIESHGGIVDKYIGDSVMAVFGAPIWMADHAARAVACAAALRTEMENLNRMRSAGGLEPLVTGIGIATGLVVVGNMGSETRHNYTVIGDAVNLASRLQDLTKSLGDGCLVSAATAALCDSESSPLEPCGKIAVRGKAEPVEVFMLRPVPEANIRT